MVTFCVNKHDVLDKALPLAYDFLDILLHVWYDDKVLQSLIALLRRFRDLVCREEVCIERSWPFIWQVYFFTLIYPGG